MIANYVDTKFRTCRERFKKHNMENTGKLQITHDRVSRIVLISGMMTITFFNLSDCDQVYSFTAEDLVDQGEIGRGAYGTVNKMYHEASGTIMAVKVVFEMLIGKTDSSSNLG